jgi:ubiquinone/menaquinone biosynthesis C-methylase UbiE
MTKKVSSKYFDILAARKVYAEGKNVTDFLRTQKQVSHNTIEIIETAYDLQAGTYIEHAKKNAAWAKAFTGELAAVLDRHIGDQSSILDVGTGEMTTLDLVVQALSNKPRKIFAFDISWSRLHKGLAYVKDRLANDHHQLIPFVADMREIPLLDKSISVTTSSHALEPNGAELPELMTELFRITRDKLVLTEPCYEINTEEGKRRMDKLGYIKDLDGVVQALGGTMLEKVRIQNPHNPLNPAVCFVIKPPTSTAAPTACPPTDIFSVPGTNLPLRKIDDFYFSDDTGLCFSVLKSIPILKSDTAILASALID